MADIGHALSERHILGLHQKIFATADRRAVLVRPVINNGRNVEVPVPRGGWCRPFEAIGIPRIAPALGAEENAVHKITEQKKLRKSHQHRSGCHELI